MGRKSEFLGVLLFGDMSVLRPKPETFGERFFQIVFSDLRFLLPFLIVIFLVVGLGGLTDNTACNRFFGIFGVIMGIPYSVFAFYVWCKVYSR